MGLALSEIAAAAGKKWTYTDYHQLPEGAPYQLIGGELIMTPAPTTRHQKISIKLATKMYAWVEAKNLGQVLYAPVDVYLEDEETYQPDLVFISRNRLNIIEEEKINGAPDLVVEILSPSTAYYDLRKKFKGYERHGVQEYWIIDPEDKSVQIFMFKDGKLRLEQEVNQQGTVQSRVIDGFSCDARDLFQGL